MAGRIWLLLLAVLLLCHGAQAMRPRDRVSGLFISNDDGTVTLVAEVQRADLDDSFVWTLPDGSTLTPGETNGTFTASQPSSIPGGVNMTLTLGDGFTSSAQTVVFRVEEARNRWFSTFTYNLRPAGPTIVRGEVTGKIINNDDGSVTLTADVTGGTPAANTFFWTLPDGTVLNAGDSHETFEASTTSPISEGVRLTLTLKDGYTSSNQTVVFRAEADDLWWGTFTYDLEAFTPPAIAVAVKVTGNILSNEDGSVTLVANVIGVTVEDKFVWKLPNRSRLRPGRSKGTFEASPVSATSSGVTLTLTLRDGYTSTPQKIKFRATNADRMWGSRRYRLKALRA